VTSNSSPRKTDIPLARATVTVVWHAVHADVEMACVFLGVSRRVANTLGALQLTQIDRVAERHFRRLRPRWSDQPALWRELLLNAHAGNSLASRDFNLHVLQLIAGSSLTTHAAMPAQMHSR